MTKKRIALVAIAVLLIAALFSSQRNRPKANIPDQTVIDTAEAGPDETTDQTVIDTAEARDISDILLVLMAATTLVAVLTAVYQFRLRKALIEGQQVVPDTGGGLAEAKTRHAEATTRPADDEYAPNEEKRQPSVVTSGTWNAVGLSVAGASHRSAGEPGADHCRAAPIGKNSYALVASDGAGSASLGTVGAECAVSTALEGIQKRFADGAERQEDLLVEVFEEAIQALTRLAQDEAVAMRELACTLLVCVVSGHSLWYGQVGDGVSFAKIGGSWEWLLWPDHGEYVNVTRFVTDADAMNRLRMTALSGNLDLTDILMTTDGLEHLALRFADREAHGPFLDPIAQHHRDMSSEQFSDSAREFLESDRVSSESGDDLTLVLAARV